MERSSGKAVMILFAPETLSAGVTLTLGEDAAQHARVVRIGPGEHVELRDGRGGVGSGVISRLAKRSVAVDVQDVRRVDDLPPVHLLVPVADRDRMLYLAEKATELAATSWRPVIWRRSRSVGPAGDGPAFQSRLKARMVAALTQSGGGWLPELHPAAPPARAISAAPQGTRLLLDASADDAITSVPMVAPVSIAIGPEGGLDAREREEVIAAGFQPVALVGGTLRFETAGIAGLAIVRTMLGRDAGPEDTATADDELQPEI